MNRSIISIQFILCLLGLGISRVSGQGNSCPGCVANALTCPNFTGQQVVQICLDSLPDAQANAVYEIDVTMRFTDQIAYRANDTLPGTPFTLGFLQQAGFPITIPITVDIDSARLIGIYDLPAGLEWTCDSAANGCFYSLPTSGTACFKICGTTGCYLHDTTFFVAVEVEYTQDLANLINAFSGGGSGFPFPLPIPSTQTEREVFYYPLTIRGSGAPPLQITSSALNDTIVEGETATISATTGFVSYSWSNNVTVASITVSPTQTTTYTVTVTDASGCSQTASYTLNVKEQEPIDTSSGITSIKKAFLRCYPNPAKTHLMIESNNNEAVLLQITDLQGYIVKSENIEEGKNKKLVSLTALPQGVYMLHVKTAKGVQVEKIIIH